MTVITQNCERGIVSVFPAIRFQQRNVSMDGRKAACDCGDIAVAGEG
jgi:hypothetical protein